MTDHRKDELWQVISRLGPAFRSTIAVRIALRALPLCTLGQIWTLEQQFALLKAFRCVHFAWTASSSSTGSPHGWTPQRVGMLRHLWDEGRSASEIASFLGGVSRNAVIGKAHREGLTFRESVKPASLEMGFDRVFDPDQGARLEGDVPRIAYEAVLRASWAALDTDRSIGSELDEATRAVIRAVSQLRPIYRDFDEVVILNSIHYDVNTGLPAEELIRRPLWPHRYTPPVQISVPPGRNWSFWKKWYEARRVGRTTEKLPPSLADGIDSEIALIPSEVWEHGPPAIGYEIARLLREVKGSLKAAPIISEVDPAGLGTVETQSAVALVFKVSLGDVIDVEDGYGQLELTADQDATDRHREVLDSAQDIANLFRRFGLGANKAEPLVQQAERLMEALGSSPLEVRPGLLIPRGERLRQRLLAQENLDELGAEPPLPPQFISGLRVLVAAYNVYVALDPMLSRRDEARLPPELLERLVSTREGTILARSAVVMEVATERVEEAITEEATVAPAVPDPARRESRRYSESIRNLIRAAVELAFKPLKFAWSNRAGIQSASNAVGKFARWVEMHSQTLLTYFPPESAMHNIIKFIAEQVRKWQGP